MYQGTYINQIIKWCSCTHGQHEAFFKFNHSGFSGSHLCFRQLLKHISCLGEKFSAIKSFFFISSIDVKFGWLKNSLVSRYIGHYMLHNHEIQAAAYSSFLFFFFFGVVESVEGWALFTELFFRYKQSQLLYFALGII